MITLHFDLQPQFKSMNYFIYTSHQFKLLSAICSFFFITYTSSLHKHSIAGMSLTQNYVLSLNEYEVVKYCTPAVLPYEAA